MIKDERRRRVRPNAEVTQNREAEIGQLRGDFEACREIALLKDHNGWQRVKAIIEAQLAQLAEQRNDFQKINDEGLRFILKEEQDFKFFLDLVDGNDERMASLSGLIKQKEQELNDRKRQLDKPFAG
jgi:hypothetical protein